MHRPTKETRDRDLACFDLIFALPNFNPRIAALSRNAQVFLWNRL
jgi:hypothetical protein